VNELRVDGTRSQPVTAGVIAAIVGFSSSFTVVLAGLAAAGATKDEAASGLLVLSILMGITGMWLSWRTRMPISAAWSTPGAALLVSSGGVHGGYEAALGAFALAGLLTIIAGLWRPLAAWIAMIPGPLASALLAGVLLPVCLSPAKSMVAEPRITLPIIITFVVFLRFARRWAVPAVLVAAIIAVVIAQPDSGGDFHPTLPRLVFHAPVWDSKALLSIGVPLFIVTMASQNIAGMAVLRSFGFHPPLRPLLVATGGATAAGAPFGVHGVNLAAITAALVAGPDADPRPERRWIAGASSGATYVVIGPLAGVAAALVAAAPAVVISAVAGLALLGALGGALTGATADPEYRDAAIVTLVVSASGISAGGVSAPFWGLASGLVFHAVVRRRRPDPPVG
jgi:benzoate membrane transport protein